MFDLFCYDDVYYYSLWLVERDCVSVENECCVAFWYSLVDGFCKLLKNVFLMSVQVSDDCQPGYLDFVFESSGEFNWRVWSMVPTSFKVQKLSYRTFVFSHFHESYQLVTLFTINNIIIGIINIHFYNVLWQEWS